MKRLVSMVAGLVGLLVLLVGVPVVLWQVGKGYLPDVSSLGDLWAMLQRQDSGRLFLFVFLLIGAIAWLIMVVGFLLELPAALHRRPGRRIAGLGWAQRTASVLLFMIITGTTSGLMAAPANALPAPPAAAVSVAAGSGVHQAATSATATPQQARPVKVAADRPDLPSYTVRQGDTLWSIAEQTLGDGARSPEIASLNVGKAQADGKALAQNGTPRAGWVLRLPAGAKLTPRATPKPAVTPAAAPVRPASSTVTVHPGDTLSGIAQRAYGDQTQFPRIAAANHLANPDDIDAGQTLVIPAATIDQAGGRVENPAAGSTYTVRAGDDLSGIAQRAYGDETQFPRIAAANHIADPDDIDTGQTLVIPAATIRVAEPTGRHAAPPAPEHEHAAAPGEAHAAPASHTPTVTPKPHPAEPKPHPTEQPHSTERPHPVTQAPDTSRAAETRTPAPATPRAAGQGQVEAGASLNPQPQAPTSTTSTPRVEQAPAAEASSESDRTANVAPLLGLTAAAAAAVWGGLVLTRRRNSRRRRPGRATPPPSLPAVRIEKTLQERAADVDVAWLDLALRSLGVLLSDTGTPIPDIVAAELGREGLRLVLAGDQPAPEPFVTDGSSWWLPASAELPISSADAVDQLAPLPTLTSVGMRGEQTVLVDLEQAGAISVQGDTAAGRELLNHLVVELAHQEWSDGVNVSMVGWGEQLVSLNPERLTYSPDIAAALRNLRARVRQVTAALDALGTDAVAARSRDIAGDSWLPQVLLVDAAGVPDEQLQELQEQLTDLSRSGRAATAVVVSGGPTPEPGVVAFQVGADGALTAPALLGVGSLTAAALNESELAGLVDLFENAEQVNAPIPPSTVDAPWAAHSDESGALLPPIALDEPIETWEATQAEPDTEPAGNEDAEVLAVPVVAVVDPASREQLERVLVADPALDADLAEWHGEQVIRPRIAILGPATVDAPGEKPKRLAWFTEVAVYLAVHHRGVPLEKFHADLWPAKGRPGEGRPISRTTRNETASKVRKWMGVHPETGETFMPLGTEGVYRLDDRLLDCELLQRLRTRGDAYAAAGMAAQALADYTAALKLVRGRVLPEAEGVRGSGEEREANWGWLANDGRREDIHVPARIVDAAHKAVQVAVTLEGQLEQARWAANLAHEVDPYSDTPLLDLLVVAAAAGDMAAANRHAWEVLWANDAEVPEDLPSDTFVVINRIFPTGLRAVSN